MFSNLFSYIDKRKLDYSHVKIETNLPVYITMSTIPSRMKNTIELIKHLLKYVSGFEKIILNIPYKYKRFPEFNVNVNHDIKDNRFILNRTHDYGPLTKIIGSLNIIPNESITIIADDMCYKLNAFKDIVEIQNVDISKSYSFYVYPFAAKGGASGAPRNVMVPQGADLISAYTRNYSDFIGFFNDFLKHQGTTIEKYVDNACFFVDDQLIGWYFQTHNIPMEQVERRHRNIYIRGCDVANKSDNLNKQTGKRSRENTMNQCYYNLNAFYPL